MDIRNFCQHMALQGIELTPTQAKAIHRRGKKLLRLAKHNSQYDFSKLIESSSLDDKDKKDLFDLFLYAKEI